MPFVQAQFGLGNPTAGLIAVWQVCCKEALQLHALQAPLRNCVVGSCGCSRGARVCE